MILFRRKPWELNGGFIIECTVESDLSVQAVILLSRFLQWNMKTEMSMYGGESEGEICEMGYVSISAQDRYVW